ncbi:MAG: lamin tail domain-containing protein [Patescibacteria group bacterium]|nr:lamin tail domain-containing protein [Patescibacteria group bacterium]
MKFFLLVFIFLGFFFFSSTPVSAGDVVINEFLVDPDADQWVELYNKGTGSIDISGWFIDDSGGSEKYTIPMGTTIGSLEFKIFESRLFNLNRISSDTIRLLNSSSLEDSYPYNTGPGVNKSYGRQTDGASNWVIFDSPTKGSSNNLSTPVPISTPTPTQIPTSTSVPTKKSTPTYKPTPQSSPIDSNIKTIPSTQKLDGENSRQLIAAQNMPTSILGEATVAGVTTSSAKSDTKSKETKSLNSKENNVSKILVVTGLVFIILCAILAFRIYRKSQNSNENV